MQQLASPCQEQEERSALVSLCVTPEMPGADAVDTKRRSHHCSWADRWGACISIAVSGAACACTARPPR